MMLFYQNKGNIWRQS